MCTGYVGHLACGVTSQGEFVVDLKLTQFVQKLFHFSSFGKVSARKPKAKTFLKSEIKSSRPNTEQCQQSIKNI